MTTPSKDDLADLLEEVERFEDVWRFSATPGRVAAIRWLVEQETARRQPGSGGA